MRERSACLHLAVLCCCCVAVASCVREAPAGPIVDPVVDMARGEDIFLPPPAGRVVEQAVPARSTLASLLDEHGLDRNEAERVIEAVREVFDPRRMHAGNTYRLSLDPGGGLRRFEYEVDDDQFLRVRAGDGGAFDAELAPYVKERVEETLRGFIDREHTSLVAALNGAGESVVLAIELADVLGGAIDFNTELQPGDQFDVLYEKLYREGEFAGYGSVLATEFVNAGRRVRAFRFEVPGSGEALYYDQQGQSLRRQFLRSPFRFEPRVTSRFSRSRLHPILGTYRPHLGVDYGAPTGTPVVAVASGTVVAAGRGGSAGNRVKLRHTNGYETHYLHLSKFAPGVRRGARVGQGQTIGFVGATGLATGPHLDYRMSRNGAFVDPLVEHRNLPPGTPVPARHLAAFHELRDRALERMSAGIAGSARPSLAAD